MTLTVRRARKDDKPTFMRLWKEFLEEQRMYGSPVLPTSRTVAAHAQLFDCYDTGVLFGNAIVTHDDEHTPPIVGVLMWGEHPYPAIGIETELGRCATLWGIYIQPSHRNRGLGDPLMAHMFDAARDVGFDTIVTTMVRGNPVLRGDTPEGGLQDHLIDKRGARSEEFMFHWRLKE